MIRTLLIAALISANAFASENDHHDDHDQAKEDHHEEENKSVGRGKGILEASEQNGFKLSEKALKHFDLKLTKLNSKAPWTLPVSAVVHSGDEINFYRKREGFFKRIDFRQISKSKTEVVFDSPDLKTGDEVVVSGLGFLRVAELAATGEVAHGHSH